MAINLIRSKQHSVDAVLLCDTSGSMERRDTETGRRRIDHLAEVLSGVLSRRKVRHVITFDSWVRELTLGPTMDLPEPSGGTALDLALDFVADMEERPAQVILITDGEPNSQEAAFEAMRRLPGVVLTAYYVGPDYGLGAIEFLRALAKLGAAGSSASAHSIAKPAKLVATILLQLTYQPG